MGVKFGSVDSICSSSSEPNKKSYSSLPITSGVFSLSLSLSTLAENSTLTLFPASFFEQLASAITDCVLMMQSQNAGI